jgi:hypothetical protein
VKRSSSEKTAVQRYGSGPPVVKGIWGEFPIPRGVVKTNLVWAYLKIVAVVGLPIQIPNNIVSQS